MKTMYTNLKYKNGKNLLLFNQSLNILNSIIFTRSNQCFNWKIVKLATIHDHEVHEVGQSIFANY